MTGRSELRIHCRALPPAAAPLRHALAAFLNVLDVESELSDDILTAVGEALANAVEHAYEHFGDSAGPGDIELYARVENSDTLSVDIFDRGRFIERALRPGRGFGLRIVRAIAREVTIKTDGGTQIRMIFEARRNAGSAAVG